MFERASSLGAIDIKDAPNLKKDLAETEFKAVLMRNMPLSMALLFLCTAKYTMEKHGDLVSVVKKQDMP